MDAKLRKIRNAKQERKRRDRETEAIKGLRCSLAAFQHVDGKIVSKMEKSEVLQTTVAYMKKLKQEQLHVVEISKHSENNRFRADLILGSNQTYNLLEAIPNSNIIKHHLLCYLGHLYKNDCIVQHAAQIKFRTDKTTSDIHINFKNKYTKEVKIGKN